MFGFWHRVRRHTFAYIHTSQEKGKNKFMRVFIVLGDGLKGKGGIARNMSTVVETMLRDTDTHVDVFAMRRTSSTTGWVLMLPVRVIQLTHALIVASPDVVHINISDRGSSVRKFIVWLVCKMLKKPTILHLHSSRYQSYFVEIPSIWAGILRWMYRNTDRVVVLGEVWAQFARDVLTVPVDRIRIVNNSVADPGISANLNVPDCNMLFLGLVGERKGVPELLQALAMPDLRCRSWHLTIAGNGDLEKYQALIEDAALEQRIHLEGWVDKPRVRELLRSSQILVLPSRAENQPLSVLEGMSCGLAIVATRVGAVPEVIDDHESGLLINVQDPAGLARALVELIDNESLRVKVGSGARAAYVRKYRPEIQARALLNVYREALASN
jgi:glycosyltransferase involved in cell wall biosynthesis